MPDRIRVTGIDLAGYMTTDAARAIAWYRDVLGLEPASLYPANRGAEYELADGTTFGLWGGLGDVVPFQAGNGICFPSPTSTPRSPRSTTRVSRSSNSETSRRAGWR
jgi:catechol 2,3-dioxygenase-like lactoylglutathione lyase family enzyme